MYLCRCIYILLITYKSEPGPEIINWVYLRGTTNQFCRQSYNHNSIIVDSTLCARYYHVTSQSTCSGDSGGGLTVVDDDGEISQVGVSSFVSGYGCHVVIPAGFVIPGHYHPWFTEVTGINFDWKLGDGKGSDESGSGSSESDSGSDKSRSDSDGNGSGSEENKSSSDESESGSNESENGSNESENGSGGSEN